MSRIGKLPIEIIKGVDISISSDNEIAVKCAKNVLKVSVKPVINVKVKDGYIILTRKNDEPKVRALHGLYRALIQNAVTGVTKGWTKTLILKGVGYKAQVEGNLLKMNLGFSHPVHKEIPQKLTVKAEKTTLIISGSDRAEVGQFSAQIRSLRKPEPYLGKGIRYSDEVIRRKAGKSGGDK